MSARRDPELVAAEKRERGRSQPSARGPFPVASSATTRIPRVTARWTDSDRTHVWWRCQFCGVRHVEGARDPEPVESGRLRSAAFPTGDDRVHTSCGNLVRVQVVEW